MEPLQRVHQSIDATLPRMRRWLEDLIRIPSVSAAGFDPTHVRASAELTRNMLEAAGLQRARLLSLEDAHPYVAAEWLGAEDAPTVLLYAHHDVQPAGRVERWSSDPFTPVERNGRLFGRGSADDKAGAVIHAAAVAGWLGTTGALPCNVKVLIEGEEEIGSGHLHAFLSRFGDELRSDVMVLADAGNWSVGQPALTYALRGLTEVTVRVRALRAPQHSGMFGGVVPDPVQGLAKMLATLTDDEGRIAVRGLADDVRPLNPAQREAIRKLPFDNESYAAIAGMVPGVRFIGDPETSALERIWMQPAIAVIGLDAHPIHGSSNQIIADAAARISVRLAPGQDPARVRNVVADHLRRAAPWGLQVEIDTSAEAAPAWVCEPTGPAFEAADAALRAAFGIAPVYMGVGGTIPFVGPFAAAFGGVPALLTGPSDPTSRIHSEDESLHLADWRNHCHAEANLFTELTERMGRRQK
jgi:acetylornithine deacetylase/succinyl-diaminopimelate desuccinylase-like protein